MEGLAETFQNIPAAAGGPAPIDIEDLLQLALQQPVYRPFRVVSERALAYNYGYTAVPKGCHGGFAGGEVLLRVPAGADAAAVVAAVNALDPWTRAIVRRCAVGGTRPDWFEGVGAPRRVAVMKRHKRRHRKVKVGERWEPCSPQAICAAREIYARWHSAVTRLAEVLRGRLTDWRITGFAAPESPWEAGSARPA